MTKQEFLAALEKKLQILDEGEKQDIIAEHDAIIEEKKKSGQSEAEAVADFGKVNDLAKEILKAYKIDPDYKKSEENFQNAKEAFDAGVKNVAEWISDKAEDFFASDEEGKRDVTLAKIFEIIIKVLLIIILLHVLRIPFSIISGLGASLFAMTIFPFSLLQYLWFLMVEILFVVLIVVTIILIFDNDFFGSKKTTAPAEKAKPANSKKQTSKAKEAPTAKKPPTSEPNNAGVILFKILIIVFLLLPLLIFGASLLFSLAFLVFLIFNEVVLIGLLLLNIALLGLVFFVVNLLLGIFNNKVPSGWFLLPIALFFMLGIIFTVDWAMDLSIAKEEKGVLTKETLLIPKEDFKASNYWYDYEVKIDPTVADGKVAVNIYYDEKYQDLVRVADDGIVSISLDSWQEFRSFSQNFIPGLKEDKLYIPYYEIEVFAQEATIQYID